MLLFFLEQYYFLQALGWGIGNSLWQAALLWVFYKAITTGSPQISAAFKYQLSMVLLFGCLAWFGCTTFNQYSMLQSESGLSSTAVVSISGTAAMWFRLMSIGYLCLLAGLVIRFLFGLKRVHGIRWGSMEKSPVSIRLFTATTALNLGISKTVQVWLSDNVDIPSVIGFFKPVILLPIVSFNQLTIAQAESIILHELAHIKRNDYLANLLQMVVELLLFFNPFVKILGSIARKERENCCDDWVLSYRYNRQEYASALMLLEQHRTQSVALTMSATSGKKLLLARIKRLFTAQPVSGTNRGYWLKLWLAALVVLVAIGSMMPGYQPSRKAIPETVLVNTTQVPYTIAARFKQRATITSKVPGVYANPPDATVYRERPEKKKLSTPGLPDVEAHKFTLVNEALMQYPGSQPARAITVSGSENTNTRQLLVEVEEEQSGVDGKTSYILMVQQNDGQAEVTPLIISGKKLKPSCSKKPDSTCFPSSTIQLVNSKAVIDESLCQ